MMFRGLALLLVLWSVTVVAGCATTKANPDPWEPMNRGTFAFNEFADEWVVSPVARAWRFVLPNVVETGIDNFFENAGSPVAVVNNVLQGELEEGYLQTWRFVLNSTFGIAGFIDVATMIDIPQNDEDFGQTLGFWGVPSGPYLVLPIFGPSTIRGGVGRLGDAAGTYYFSLLPIWATFLVRGVELINLRARFLEEVDENRRESFDYYVFLRDAYLQNRASRIGRARGEEEAGPAPGDDLYYFEDDEYLDEGQEWLEEEERPESAGSGGPPGAPADGLEESAAGASTDDE